MITQVVNVYRDEYDIYIGRIPTFGNTKWGNPFSQPDLAIHEKLECYEYYIRNTPELWNSLHELKGKRLACHCKPKLCHGDVLLKLVYERFGKESDDSVASTFFDF